jgi:predicted nucleic acid-binding protein
VIYLDSSAVVKLARAEAETDALRAWLAAHPAPLVVSALARTESARALQQSEPAALPVLTMVLAVLHPHPVSDAILDRAAALPGAQLRSLDAIHLATAEALGESVRAFVAYDKRLADAAIQRGLTVVAPAMP